MRDPIKLTTEDQVNLHNWHAEGGHDDTLAGYIPKLLDEIDRLSYRVDVNEVVSQVQASELAWHTNRTADAVGDTQMLENYRTRAMTSKYFQVASADLLEVLDAAKRLVNSAEETTLTAIRLMNEHGRRANAATSIIKDQVAETDDLRTAKFAVENIVHQWMKDHMRAAEEVRDGADDRILSGMVAGAIESAVERLWSKLNPGQVWDGVIDELVVHAEVVDETEPV